MENTHTHYCAVIDCDDWPDEGNRYCPRHDYLNKLPRRHLARHERLQAMADSGCDTWEEYRGER